MAHQVMISEQFQSRVEDSQTESQQFELGDEHIFIAINTVQYCHRPLFNS